MVSNHIGFVDIVLVKYRGHIGFIEIFEEIFFPNFSKKMPIFGHFWPKNGQNIEFFCKILSSCPKIGLFLSYWYWVEFFWPIFYIVLVSIEFLANNDSRIGIGSKFFLKFFVLYWSRMGFLDQNFLVVYWSRD